MLEEIVVLLDGSRLAESVLPHTRALARIFGSRVTLLHVLESTENGERGRLDPVKWHLRKMEAESFLRDAAQAWDDEPFETATVLLEGSAAGRIVEYVDEAGPDLLMLSSHGRSGISPWNINSVAAKIVDRVTCSVMLIRAYDSLSEPFAATQYRRVMLALHHSKRAECALPFAGQVVASHDAELWLALALAPLHILNPHTLAPDEREALAQLSERNENEARHYLEQLAEQIVPRPQTHVIPGSSTAETLLDFAESNEIDLVIMSAHGYSGESAHTYDSVVANFIRYGSIPLFILQDLAPDQIAPTKAELHASTKGGGRPSARPNTPAAWAVHQSIS